MYLKHFLGMARFALYGLHMVANSTSSDKCIFIICISYLPTKANGSIGLTEKQPLPITVADSGGLCSFILILWYYRVS